MTFNEYAGLMCQWFMVVFLVLSFLRGTYMDFNGMKTREPGGFSGFIGTIVSISLVAWLFYGAGAFDRIFP